MRLRDYLRARGESESAFAARAGVPQSTINLICQGRGTRVSTAAKIVRASRESPAPDGGTVRFEDLVPHDPRGGSGIAAKGAV